jgi:hypothetical protein
LSDDCINTVIKLIGHRRHPQIHAGKALEARSSWV